MIFGILAYCVIGCVCVFVGHITDDCGYPFVNDIGEAIMAFFFWPLVLLPLISLHLSKLYKKNRKDNQRK